MIHIINNLKKKKLSESNTFGKHRSPHSLSSHCLAFKNMLINIVPPDSLDSAQPSRSWFQGFQDFLLSELSSLVEKHDPHHIRHDGLEQTRLQVTREERGWVLVVRGSFVAMLRLYTVPVG